MVSSSIWGLAPNKVVEQELPLRLLLVFGGLPSSPGSVSRKPEAFFSYFST